jgi:NADP-dependent 3-hydroxy acid dehydrogenase YdfG
MSLEPLDKITAGEIERVFRTNVMGAMQLTSGLIENIKAANGDIVNVSSTVGTKAYENQAAYGASKWAMRGFSQNLQLELKNSGVRVVSFCVGGFRSKIGEKVGKPLTDPENWMDSKGVALFMQQILDLPKSMEVSEIIINRKSAQ